jgi:hypothetical protein
MSEISVWNIEEAMKRACQLDDEIKARMAETITPLQDQLDELKAQIAQAAINAGETLRTPYGRVEYVRGGERVTWDSKALEGYAAAHPEILKFKTVKATEPSARIKFEVKP